MTGKVDRPKHQRDLATELHEGFDALEARRTSDPVDDEPSVMGAGCGTSPMPTEAQAREAYKGRYVARMIERGINAEDAGACFDAGDVDWQETPEDAADAEIEYWSNDGD